MRPLIHMFNFQTDYPLGWLRAWFGPSNVNGECMVYLLGVGVLYKLPAKWKDIPWEDLEYHC